jgi:hypothetical protein
MTAILRHVYIRREPPFYVMGGKHIPRCITSLVGHSMNVTVNMAESTTRRDMRRSTNIAKSTVCGVDHTFTQLGEVELSKHANKKAVASGDREKRKRAHKTNRKCASVSTRDTRYKTSAGDAVVSTKRDKRTGKCGGVSGHTKRVVSKTPSKMKKATGTRMGKGKRTIILLLELEPNALISMEVISPSSLHTHYVQMSSMIVRHQNHHQINRITSGMK